MKSKTKKQDQFGVILDDINSKVGLILEGHSALDRKMDNIKVELTEKIDLLAFGQATLTKEFKDFRSEMTDFKEEMTDFKEEMTDFKSEMTGFKKDTESSFKTVLQHLINIDDELGVRDSNRIRFRS